jgi:hypothetical protein
MQEYRKKNKDEILQRQKDYRRNNAIKWLWKQMYRRKDVLNISREEFYRIYAVPQQCPVLGIPISFDMTRDNLPSVDRIDSSRPYEVGNICIMSYRANMIKSVGSAVEHQKIADWLNQNGFGEIAGKCFDYKHPAATTVLFGRERKPI